ncbi:vitelline membrane protein Vm26Aa-like [Episyrphus balteatus]|uniref:vitelline membrane protein Vm26Aa-like n=1 Tax=Episyrphus balteatus TaxID=286459 RepID=UPI00248547E5|nr:vitelline membrane protein Vm26Aa-like [Episyrphus balteatus]
MQFLICLISIAGLVAVSSSASVPENILDSLSEASELNSPSELTRFKKSAYGGGSIPAPPCPKSYLFSCQSNVAPVPCAPAPSYAPAPAPAYAPKPAPAPAYAPAPAPAKPSYAGAYSVPVPRYSLPQAAYPGIPQELLRPVYGYNNQYLY